MFRIVSWGKHRVNAPVHSISAAIFFDIPERPRALCATPGVAFVSLICATIRCDRHSLGVTFRVAEISTQLFLDV
jgi:hypothetical protein